MASTPSTSAVSAVLRCRGNFWTRNPPTNRPASSAYSLGLTGDSPAERTRSKEASAWEPSFQGDRVLAGRLYKSIHVVVIMLTEKDSYERKTLGPAKLLQSAGDAHSSGVQNALVRQQAGRLISNLPGLTMCTQIIRKIINKTYAPHICKVIIVQKMNEFPVLNVLITFPWVMENARQMPSFVLTGWSTLKSSCVSLTALVSEFMLVVLWRSSSSPDDAPQHQDIKNNAFQANGHIHSPTGITSSKDNFGSGHMIPEGRPD
ncbi:uncharacterized protein LOC117946658 [Etheostoma cragini]|uniref:uncharacterized protein LOC117946658 n=1 Tax=Etheostoma cragini TaxID=417921 RepID=UPI00155E6E67|nr:uncharacterized protein LOC117946658 [Etheostoma cragini]